MTRDPWIRADALGVFGIEAVAAEPAPVFAALRELWSWIDYPTLILFAWSVGALIALATS